MSAKFVRTCMSAMLVAWLLAPPATKVLSQKPRGDAQQSKAEATKLVLGDLREMGRVHFSAPEPVVLDPDTKCDGRGNMYLVYSDKPFGADGALPIQRLSPDSRSVVRYVLQQSSEYPLEFRLGWDVTPWGTVYAFVRGFRHSPPLKHELAEYSIVKFKEDGTVDSVIKVEQPKEGYIQLHSFAAFPHGGFLIAGGFLADPANPRAVSPFTGVYSQDGHLFREVELVDLLKLASGRKGRADDSSQDGPPQGEALQAVVATMQGRMVGAPNGNIYSLRGTDPPVLYVISPSGELLSEVNIEFESTGLEPVFMSLPAQGGAYIEFVHVATGRPTEDSKYRTTLALVDIETGKVRAAFREPGEGRVMASACVTPDNQILFLGGSDDGKLDLVKYAMP